MLLFALLVNILTYTTIVSCESLTGENNGILGILVQKYYNSTIAL